jgi:hypothetical protein
MINKMYMRVGETRSTSHNKSVMEVEEQIIEDRFGDVPK